MSVAEWIETGIAASTVRDCVIIVVETTSANLRWANNALTTNGQMHDRQATVISFGDVPGGVSAAVVSGPVADRGALLALVEAGARAAAAAPASEEVAPIVTDGVDAGFAADHLAGDEPAGIEVLAGVAAGLGRAFDAAGGDRLYFGFAEHALATTWLATSAGARRRHVQPTGRLELNAKRPDFVNSAWVGRSTSDFTDVDTDAVCAEVIERLGWGDTRIELPAGRYPTLLPPSAVADLMIYALWTMSARDAEEGRNVFAGKTPGTTRLGERLSSLPLRLTSDPEAPGLQTAPFAVIPAAESGFTSVFDNGAPIERVDWLDDGVLTALIRTRAGKLSADVTGPWAPSGENLIADAGGTKSLAQMVAETERGLLVTCLWYIREVDPETLLLTGLTRDGVYLIENGRVVGAVNNFRFNESPIGLLSRATEASVAERTLCREWNDWYNLTVMPALRIGDFNMSTASKAS